MITQEIRDQVLQLKDLDRIHLIEILCDSLNQPSPEVEEIWAQESEARFAAYQAGKLAARPFAQIAAKYS